MSVAARRMVWLFEDDPDVRGALHQALELAGFTVESDASAERQLDQFNRDYGGVVVTDVRLPGVDGREVFRRLHAVDPEIPVILITGHGELQEAVDLMREGAYDFISKPFSSARLLASVRNALDQRALVIENRTLKARPVDATTPLPLLGDSKSIVSLRKTLRDLASADVSVLIVGESGTGKESVARALHDQGRRMGRPFSVLDCSTLAEDLLDAELFGVESAVGGLSRRRPGRLEAADRGTLYLDGIENLSLRAQSLLLRALDEQQVRPVGGSTFRSIDCRVVSAAGRDLAGACASGDMRSDLYFRLNTVTLSLPPLRERRDDIAALFIELLARAARRLKRPAPTLTRAVKRHLYDHHWPGNIRELGHFADRVVLGIDTPPGTPQDDPVEALPLRVEQFEASLIRDALRASSGDVRRALERLRIPRKTFYDKVARHGIDLGEYRHEKS